MAKNPVKKVINFVELGMLFAGVIRSAVKKIKSWRKVK